MPALPGRAADAPRRAGSAASFQASACSRPPPPTTRTRIAQCRKWRTPVKTMATPCASAAAITSSSRMLPPGWTMAVAPAAIASSRPSGNGKNASLAEHRAARARCRAARRARARCGPARRATSARRRAPSVRSAVAKHDRVRLDVLHDPPGEGERAQLVGGRAPLGHAPAPRATSSIGAVGVLHEQAADDAAHRRLRRRRRVGMPAHAAGGSSSCAGARARRARTPARSAPR